MFHIVLFQPEVPPNTGNIIRLAANTGCQLHLIRPLGFVMDDRRLQRAGLDYHEWAEIKYHDNFDNFVAQHNGRIFMCESNTSTLYHQVRYCCGDAFVFGPETRGLPNEMLTQNATITIPMKKHSRSLNLSNSVAVILFEALRQIDFTHF